MGSPSEWSKELVKGFSRNQLIMGRAYRLSSWCCPASKTCGRPHVVAEVICIRVLQSWAIILAFSSSLLGGYGLELESGSTRLLGAFTLYKLIVYPGSRLGKLWSHQSSPHNAVTFKQVHTPPSSQILPRPLDNFWPPAEDQVGAKTLKTHLWSGDYFILWENATDILRFGRGSKSPYQNHLWWGDLNKNGLYRFIHVCKCYFF